MFKIPYYACGSISLNILEVLGKTLPERLRGICGQSNLCDSSPHVLKVRLCQRAEGPRHGDRIADDIGSARACRSKHSFTGFQ